MNVPTPALYIPRRIDLAERDGENMRRCRRVKIVATLGPASQEPHLIHRLYEAGVDVFRINMSHTDHTTLTGYVKAIRNVERALARQYGASVPASQPESRWDALGHVRRYGSPSHSR